MNIFGITSLMIFFAGLGFGFFIYSSDKKSILNRSWFMVSIFTALWGLSLFGVTATLNPAVALKWQYLLDISALLIPVTYFYFICNLLKIKSRFLTIFIFSVAALIGVFSVTTYFKSGVALIKYGFFWIQPGPYYSIFPVFFVSSTIISLVLLIRAYFRHKEDRIFRAQIRNTLIAAIIGFGGGVTNFFPQLINIYPFGNYFVLLYVFFMSYGVLKYKLLSTKIISAQLLTGAIVLIFLFDLLRSRDISEWSIKLALFILIVIFSIFLVKGVFKEVEQKEHIERLAKDLEKANEKLKELDHLKSEFLSLATHQLRAPLTAIKGYSSMLIEGDFGILPQKAKESVQTISKSCQNLINIVEDFLNISRIEQGRMVYQKSVFDLKELVKECLNELKPNIDKAGLSLEVKMPIETANVEADRGKLKQIVGNLIDNAVKYTLRGSIYTTVSIKHEHMGRKASIEIKDTGVGIDPSEINKLFVKFSRTKDANKTNVLGTGLGLYIAKKMVEAQGGDIKAFSEGVGKGSTFTINLPLNK